jgi:hypothetical protein
MKNLIRIQKYYFKLIALFCFAFIVGCDDFVVVDQPNSQLTTDAIFENATTANAAMVDVYAQLRENGLLTGKSYGISSLLGTYSDELVSYENGAFTTADFYNNSILASDPFISILWNSSYNQIYASNAVFEGVGKSTSLASNVKNQLQGEALFVRALIHFYLVSVFGDVPYLSTTDYVFNSTTPRTASQVVYQNIISDLETSIKLLPEGYTKSDRTRPNKAVAQALLARVFLNNGNFAEASNMASALLNDNVNYIWENNLDAIFLKESTTTIWQLASGAAGANTEAGSTFIFFSGPPELVALSDNFVSQFETNDLRKSSWIKEVTEGNGIWYHPYKYKQDIATGSSMEYSVIFRLAEQYLIRAEARARQGEITGAAADLNKIRNTAGLANTAANTQSALLEAVLQERKFELFTEYGHRFFDLKRFGKLDAVLGAKAGWSANDQLWPLPQSELLVNPSLKPQNPGY